MNKLISEIYLHKRYLYSVFIIGFIIRILFAQYLSAFPFNDDFEYHTLAISLAEGKGFSIDNQPTAYRAPGYPIFLSICYSIFGPSVRLINFLQACIDICTCILLYLIAKKVFDLRIAFYAVLVLALFPLHLLYITRLLSEILFTALLMLAVWIMIRQWNENKNFLRLLLTGLTVGLASLVRPSGMIIIVLAAWFLWDRFQPLKTNLLRTACLITVFSVVLLPWMVRNKIVFDRFAITSNTGINFWIGNNVQAKGGFYFPPENNPLAKIKDDFYRSELGFQLALNDLKNHPTSIPVLLAKKLAHFFSSDYDIMLSLQYKPEWKTYPSAALIYNELSVPLWLLLSLPYVLVMVLGVVGIVFKRNDPKRSIQLLIYMILGFIFIHLVFFGCARFRVPIIPIIIIFAVSGWWDWKKKTLEYNRRKCFTAITLITLLLAIWIAEYVTLRLKVEQLKEQKLTPAVGNLFLLPPQQNGTTFTDDPIFYKSNCYYLSNNIFCDRIKEPAVMR